MKDNVPSPVAFATNADGALNREFEPYKNYKNYCERLRQIMIRHLPDLTLEFKEFFIDSAVTKSENGVKMECSS